jgi:hypothetical protein
METWLLIITLYGGDGTIMTIDMNPEPTLAACALEGQSIVNEYRYVIDEPDFWNPESLQAMTYDCTINKPEIS